MCDIIYAWRVERWALRPLNRERFQVESYVRFRVDALAILHPGKKEEFLSMLTPMFVFFDWC